MFRFRAVTDLCNLYCKSLQHHPLATKAITAATIAGASDVVCQCIEQNPALLYQLLPNKGEDWQQSTNTGAAVVMASSSARTQINWNRILQVCLVGLLWAGPAQHTWYNFLDRFVRFTNRIGSVSTKILLDATGFTPIACKGKMAVFALF